MKTFLYSGFSKISCKYYLNKFGNSFLKLNFLTFLVFILSVPGIINAQDTCKCECEKKPKLIEFNFREKKFTGFNKLEKINDGEFYQLLIKEINSNIYKITINTSDTILESALTFPTFESISFGSLSALLKSLEESKKLALIQIDLVSDDVIIRSNEEVIFLYNKMSLISGLAIKIDNIIFGIKKIILTTQFEFYNPTLDTNYSYMENLIKLEELRNEVNAILEEVNSHKAEYDNFLISYPDTISEAAKEVVKNTTNLLNSTISKISGISTSINADNSFKLLSSVISAVNNKENEYRSMPFRLRGDLASLEISITPRDSVRLNLQSYKTKIEFPDRRMSNLSLGSAFYVSAKSNIFNTYNITNKNDSQYVISKSSNPAEIGILATINYFPFKDNFFVSAGTGISISQIIRPRLSFSLGYALGKRNLALIQIGVLLGLNEELNSPYSVGEELSVIPGSITSLRVTTSAFLSVGYAFSL